MRETLIDQFDHSHAANTRWLEYLEAKPETEKCQSILLHIARADHSWLCRCLSEEEVGEFSEDLRAQFERNREGWKELIRTCDLTAFASYTNNAGTPFFSEVGQIAFHVLQHASYHRGEIRGRVGERGWEDHPETDLIRWYRGDF